MFRTTPLLSKRAFHSHAALCEEWTKASLRTMKKPELYRLAQENRLKLSGTKNDMIIQLLTHQTAKVVGTIQKKVIEEEKEEEGEDSGWVSAFEIKVAQRGIRTPIIDYDSKPHPFHNKPSTLIQPKQDKPKPEFSVVPAIPILSATTKFEQPVEAVATTKFEQPIEAVATTKFEQPIEAVATTKFEQPINAAIEGMDPQWVEAFDLKVGSRGARRQLTDTLSPALADQLNSILFDKKDDKVVGKKFDHVKRHTEKHGTQHYYATKKSDDSQDNKHEVTTEEKKSDDSHQYLQDSKHEVTEEEKRGHHPTATQSSSSKEHFSSEVSSSSNDKEKYSDSNKQSSNSQRKTWISTTVGTSMLLWYMSGEEGLSKIWHFLTSSS